MKKNYTVVLQGDSVTDSERGLTHTEPNKYMGLGYASLVCARLLSTYPEADVQVYNRGVGGDRIVNLYARWKQDALNLNPDLLSILIGVNDTWHEFDCQNGVELPRYERIYRELIEWTRTALPQTQIMLIEPFAAVSEFFREEMAPELEERRKIVEKLSKEYKTLHVSDQWFRQAKKEADAWWEAALPALES